MKSQRLSRAEVADIVEVEGLGYAVQCYLSAEDIANPSLRRKWEQAAQLLDEIDVILGTGEL